jgi:hypothetical protein
LVAFGSAFYAGPDLGTPTTSKELEIKLFTDGDDKAQIRDIAELVWIRALPTIRTCSTVRGFGLISNPIMI